MNLVEIIESLACIKDESSKGNSLLAEADKERWLQIRNSEFFSDYFAEIRQAAEKFLAEPIKALRFSDYKKFDETGSREEYQKEYFERRERLCAFGIMFLVYGDRIYQEALEDVIWAICDEYTWCLPAHLEGRSLEVIEQGTDIPFCRSHDRQVDLFNAETGFALVEILYLAGDKLATLVRHRARRLIKERILEPFCEINNVFEWETATHNWAAVCGGSVGAAAIYLLEDDNTLAPIIQRVLDTMDCFLRGYQEDGVCTEGMTYWTYGFGFFTYFSELLRQRTAGRIDLMQQEKVKRIAVFQQNGYLTENKTVSISDAPLSVNFQLGLTCYLKNRFEGVELPDIRYRSGFHNDHCYRWPHIVRDFLWGYNGTEEKGKRKDSCFMEQSQWFVSRTVVNDKEVCLAAKGGNNDEPHNHNDIGSFIFHINGATLLTDIGAGEYTKQYFGPERYTLLCNSSRGHSVPIVDGKYQKEGSESRAEKISCVLGEKNDVFAMDISKAYATKKISSLQRSFEIKKECSEVLIIEDRYILKSPCDSITERFVSFYEPKLVEKGLIRLIGEKEGIDILFNASICSFKLNSEVYSMHDTTKRKVYLLDFELLKEALKDNISVKFEIRVK